MQYIPKALQKKYQLQRSDIDDSVNDIQMAESGFVSQVTQFIWSKSILDTFATSSLDGTINIYQVQLIPTSQGRHIVKLNSIKVSNQPIDCMAGNNDLTIFYCGIGNNVLAVDMKTNKIETIGEHNQKLCKIFCDSRLVISISYDQTIQFNQHPQGFKAISEQQLDYMPQVADYSHPKLIVGFNSDKLSIIIIRNQDQQDKIRYLNCPLGTEGTGYEAIKIYESQLGFGISSKQGYVQFMNIQLNAILPWYDCLPDFKFKPRNIRIDQVDNLIPANIVLFNSRYEGNLITATMDGALTFWDFHARNKIKTYTYENNTISNANTSPDGIMMVYSLKSQDEAHSQVKLLVHIIDELELEYEYS